MRTRGLWDDMLKVAMQSHTEVGPRVERSCIGGGELT